jgi:DNA-binding transcriptional ArsR family regulator
MPRYVDADARVLRAAAHPTRGAIVYELFARGESTATDISAAIGEPVNSVSFHLRQLAKYGIVEEAPNPGGDRRQRWWRMPHDGYVVDRERIRREPGGDAVIAMRRRHALAWWTDLLERYFLVDHPDEELWSINEMPVRLTDDEAREMAEEVHAVLMRWRDKGREHELDGGGDKDDEADEGDEGDEGDDRRTYLGFSVIVPHQPDLARDYPADAWEEKQAKQAKAADGADSGEQTEKSPGEVGDDESVGGAA